MAYRRTQAVQERLDATRARIVAAAHALIAEKGYAGCSVALVADAAGVATGSVYRHFPDKGALFAEVFRTATQREVDAVVGGRREARVDRGAGRARRRDLRAPRAQVAAARLRADRRAGRPPGRGRAPRLPPRLPRHLRPGDRRRGRLGRAAGPGPRGVGGRRRRRHGRGPRRTPSCRSGLAPHRPRALRLRRPIPRSQQCQLMRNPTHSHQPGPAARRPRHRPGRRTARGRRARGRGVGARRDPRARPAGRHRRRPRTGAGSPRSTRRC